LENQKILLHILKSERGYNFPLCIGGLNTSKEEGTFYAKVDVDIRITWV